MRNRSSTPVAALTSLLLAACAGSGISSIGGLDASVEGSSDASTPSPGGEDAGAGSDSGAPVDASAQPQPDAGSTADATVPGGDGTIADPLVAFPASAPGGDDWAQGGGSASTGGRGGTVYRISSLADDGAPGTLRHCVNQTGKRTCVFAVAGTIALQSQLDIGKPYLTVAGQTAPGDGIQLTGPLSNPAGGSTIRVIADHVVLRYLRVRHGYNFAEPSTERGGFGIYVPYMGGHSHIVIDHCSVQWATDKAIGVWGNTDASGTFSPKNITWSWSIAGENLLGNTGHIVNWITGAQTLDAADGMTEIDFHHNYAPSGSHRYPLYKNKSGRIINNLLYDWRYFATLTGGGVQADVIGNIYKPGPMSPTSGDDVWEIRSYMDPTCPSCGPRGSASLFVEGNVGPHDATGTNNWASMVRLAVGINGTLNGENGHVDAGPLAEQYRRSPWARLPAPAGGEDVRVDAASALEAKLLPVVGASRRLDCLGNWHSNRDALDARHVREWETRTSTAFFHDETASPEGGFPVIRRIDATAECAAGAADNAQCVCRDADKNGLPDAWEAAWGVTDGPNGHHWPDGYTNLEHYLSGQNGK